MSSYLDLENSGAQIYAFSPVLATCSTHRPLPPLSTVKQFEKKSIPRDEVKDAKARLNRESHTERGKDHVLWMCLSKGWCMQVRQPTHMGTTLQDSDFS